MGRFLLKGAIGLISLIVIAGLYLSFWPVSIDPVEWQAPKDPGYTGDFAPNTDLANLERLSIGETYGPEDMDAYQGADGLLIYASGHQGEIIEINPRENTHTVIANTGGVPLGVEFGDDGMLYVADAHKGLLSVTRDGKVTVLTDRVNGTPINYADDLDIGPDGVIYFSDASTKFGAKANKSTLSASLLEIMEHRGTGRVLAYDPASKETSVIKEGMVFPNGVVMGPDDEKGHQTILVNETGEYRVHRIWVTGPALGSSEIIIGNLPGFPDNINPGPDGTYLLGLISQRSKWLDDNSMNPKMRALSMRLPASMRPTSVSYGLIVQIDGSGKVLKTWQDPTGDYPNATGAIIADDGYMYVSSLSAPDLARMKLTND